MQAGFDWVRNAASASGPHLRCPTSRGLRRLTSTILRETGCEKYGGGGEGGDRFVGVGGGCITGFTEVAVLVRSRERRTVVQYLILALRSKWSSVDKDLLCVVTELPRLERPTKPTT